MPKLVFKFINLLASTSSVQVTGRQENDVFLLSQVQPVKVDYTIKGFKIFYIKKLQGAVDSIVRYLTEVKSKPHSCSEKQRFDFSKASPITLIEHFEFYV